MDYAGWRPAEPHERVNAWRNESPSLSGDLFECTQMVPYVPMTDAEWEEAKSDVAALVALSCVFGVDVAGAVRERLRNA
jgi:hypothetical protein